MKVKVENVKDKANEVKLEFTVEAEKFEEAIQTVYKKNAKYFNIPGFRKGKAPFKMVEKAFCNKVIYNSLISTNKLYQKLSNFRQLFLCQNINITKKAGFNRHKKSIKTCLILVFEKIIVFPKGFLDSNHQQSLQQFLA